MAEHLILPVSDCQNTLHESLVLGENCPEREGVDSRTARLLFQKSGTSRIRHVNGHIIIVVHLLQVCADSHNQQALQRNMLLLAKTHQPLGRLLLQMEDIQRRVHLRGGGKSRPCPGEFLTRLLQLSRSLNAVKNRLRSLDQLLEIFPVPCLRLTSRLVSKILFQLLGKRTHIERIRVLKFDITVKLNHVPQKTDQRLGIHQHMVSQHVKTLTAVRRLNHHHPVHWAVLPLERHLRPASHDLSRLLHGFPREVHVLDIALFPVRYILVPLLFLLVVCKAHPHGLTALIRLVDRPL